MTSAWRIVARATPHSAASSSTVGICAPTCHCPAWMRRRKRLASWIYRDTALRLRSTTDLVCAIFTLIEGPLCARCSVVEWPFVLEGVEIMGQAIDHRGSGLVRDRCRMWLQHHIL